MKKRLLIVLSLILASLLLVVSCEGSPETVEGVVLPEGAPSNVTSEKMELITAKPEEPKQEDMRLIQTLVEETGEFVTTDDAQKIANDFVMAVFKKGIEIKGPNYSIAMVAKADSMKAYDTMEFIASVSLDNFEFAGFTLDGSLDFVAKPDSSNSEIPFSFETRGETGITISYGNEKVTIKSSKDYEKAEKFFNSLKGKVNPEDFIKATNDLIPVFIKSLNETFREYTVSTDLLTFISSDKISGTIKVGKEGVDFGDGLTLDSKVSAFTLKPLEFNESQYKAAVFGTMNITLDNNEKYDNKVENNHESPITSKGKTLLNAFIETSGKVGDNKIQIQAQLSDVEKDNAFYLVINDKVLDLKALIPPEAE